MDNIKTYIGLNEWTLYVVEDVSGASVNKYHYEVNFLPEMIILLHLLKISIKVK